LKNVYYHCIIKSNHPTLKNLYFLLLISFSQFSFGQNLVPNPSFELYDTCPNSYSEILHAIPWFRPTLPVINTGNDGTSDYFNACFDSTIIDGVGVPQNIFGYQHARTGVAYSGLFARYPNSTPYREYIEVKLDSPLIGGVSYYVNFYVSLGDSCTCTTDAIGAYISVDSVLSNNYNELPYIPQIINPVSNFIVDKINWTKITGTYFASGGEQFITIGNFKNDSLTDTIFVPGGGIQWWNNSVYFYIDDVCISVLSDSTVCLNSSGILDLNSQNQIEIYPNPVKDKIYFNSKTHSCNKVLFFNSIGDLIFERKLTCSPFAIAEIDLSSFSTGLYFLKIESENYIITKKIQIIK